MKNQPNKAKLCLVRTFSIAACSAIVFGSDPSHASEKQPSKKELLDFLPKMTKSPPLPPTHPFMIRASKAADDLFEALRADNVPDRYTWAWRAWVWAFHESSLTPSALGDAGKSCGYLQVSNPEKVLSGATCDKVRKDGVLGFRVGMGLMKMLIDRCGSVSSALTMYATGQECPTWTLPLVIRRMKLSGDIR